jgi:hypothetical protein
MSSSKSSQKPSKGGGGGGGGATASPLKPSKGGTAKQHSPSLPTFVVPKVPASRPLQEGLDEDYVTKIISRKDESSTLEDMLDEEAMSVADLLKRKKKAERDGTWAWAPEKRALRLQRIVAGLPVGEDLLEAHEKRPDKPGSFVSMLRKNPALPRSPALCAWGGHDMEENLYVCNNGIVAPGFKFCGYHQPTCIVPHNAPAPVVAPNALGLCFFHFSERNEGRAPVAYQHPLLLPGVAYGAPANRRNQMAPPRYDTMPAEEAKKGKKKWRGQRRGGGGSGGGADERADTSDSDAGSDASSEGGRVNTDSSAGPDAAAARAAARERVAAARAAREAAASHSRIFLAMRWEQMEGFMVDQAAAGFMKRALLKAMGGALKSVRVPASVVRERALAATMIQAVVRGAYARRAVDRLRRSRQAVARRDAAALLQRNWRRIRAQRAFKLTQAREEHSAERIQRLFRRFAWRSKLCRDRALRASAVRVQRWWRFMRVRWRLRLVVARADAHRRAAAKARPTDTIYKLSMLAKLRRKVRDVKRRRKVVTRAAIIIQRAWCWYVRRPQQSLTARIRAGALLKLRGVFMMMKWLKVKFRRHWARQARRDAIAACFFIGRIARGFLGRLRARRRKRLVEAVWRWVAPTLPREIIAEHLGFPDYDRMFAKAIARVRAPTEKEFERARREAEERRAAELAAQPEPLTPWERAEEERKAAAAAKKKEEELWNDSEVYAWHDGLTAKQLEELNEQDEDKARAVVEKRRAQRERFDAIKDAPDPSTAKGTLQGATAVLMEELGVTVGEDDARMFDTVMKRIEVAKRRNKQSQLLPMSRAHGPLAPKVAEEYGVMLRPGRKPMPPPLLSPVNRLTYAARDEQAAYIDRVEDALRLADRESKGLLAAGTFERVLLTAGVTAPARLMRDLSLAFAVPGGDRVKWGEYIAFARRLDRPCPLHKVLVCPACIYPGKCDKCLCKRYECSAAAMHTFLLLNPHDATCVCGHLRARHAPAMTAHPEVDMPASFMPTMRIALGNCATLDPRAKSLAGLASPALAGFAEAAFSAPPLTVSAGVAELQGRLAPLELADLVPSVGGLTKTGAPKALHAQMGLAEDKDGGIGSLAYFSVKRAVAENRAAESGLGNQDPCMAEKNFSLRVPEGATLPATEATRRLPNGSLVGMNPMPLDKMATLEGLLADVEAFSSSQRLRGGGGSGGTPGKPKLDPRAPVETRFDIPSAAVSALPLAAITAANTSLVSLVDMCSADVTQKLKGMAAASKAASEAADRARSVTLPPQEAAREMVGDRALAAAGLATAGATFRSAATASGLTSAVPPPAFALTTSGAAMPRDAPALYVEAVKAGEVLASGAAAPSRAGTESLLAGALAAAKGGRLRAIAAADRAKRGAGPSGKPPRSPRPAVAAVALPGSALFNTLRPSEQKTQRGLDERPAGPADARLPGVDAVPLPEKSSSRAMFTYLMLLRALSCAAPDGYDLLADPSRLSTLILDQRLFLRRWWRELARDLRTGSLEGGPGGVLAPAARAALARAALAPDEARAAVFTAVMTSLGFANSGRPSFEPTAEPPTGKDYYELVTPHAALPAPLARARDAREEKAAREAARAEEAAERRRVEALVAGNLSQRAVERAEEERRVARAAQRKAREEARAAAARAAAEKAEDWRVGGWGDEVLDGVDGGSSITRPDTGATARPDTGATARPDTGATARPDTGATSASRPVTVAPVTEKAVRHYVAGWEHATASAREAAAVAAGLRIAPPPPHLRPISPSLRGDYSVAALLEPAKPQRSAYLADVAPTEEAAAARRSGEAQAARSARIAASAHAHGRTMASGAGRPQTFSENLAKIFGGEGAARAVLTRSELFTHLAPDTAADGGPAWDGSDTRLLKLIADPAAVSLAVDGIGPLMGANGEFLGMFAVDEAGRLEALPEELLRMLSWGGGGEGGGGGGGGGGAKDEEQPAVSIFNPPAHLSSPPNPFDILTAAGYSFFKLPGSRTIGCKFPGCGGTFGACFTAPAHKPTLNLHALTPPLTPPPATPRHAHTLVQAPPAPPSVISSWRIRAQWCRSTCPAKWTRTCPASLPRWASLPPRAGCPSCPWLPTAQRRCWPCKSLRR